MLVVGNQTPCRRHDHRIDMLSLGEMREIRCLMGWKNDFWKRNSDIVPNDVKILLCSLNRSTDYKTGDIIEYYYYYTQYRRIIYTRSR